MILFGNNKEQFDSRINFVILTAKSYIWTNKFNDTPLSFIAYLNFLRHKLSELKDSYDYVEKPELFTHFSPLFNSIQ